MQKHYISAEKTDAERCSCLLFFEKIRNTAENDERNTFAELPQNDILAFKGVSEMLKYSLGIIAAVFLLFYEGLAAFGAENEGIGYTIIDREAVITGYSGEHTEIEIPEFIGCYPVTEIRDNAFCNCRTLKSVIIPDTVTKLGHHCFYGCYSLKEVKLPAELEEIGEGCFCGCGALDTVELPYTLGVLPDSCFRACTSLSSVRLPKRLTSAGAFCFAGCTGLKEVQTDDELRFIGERAFFMCGKLNEIYIPPTCKFIGKQAVGFTCEGNLELKQVELLISGERGSAAEHYASENGLRFNATEMTSHTDRQNSAEKSENRCILAALWCGAGVSVILSILIRGNFFTESRNKKLK